MGRRKIHVQYIADDRTRHVTFAKRKAGLMKKAMELSILSGCEVALIVFDAQRELSEYVSNGDSRAILQEYCKKAHLPHERKTNNDYASMGRRKAKKPKPGATDKKGKKHASSDDEDNSSGSDDDHLTAHLRASTSNNSLVQEETVNNEASSLANLLFAQFESEQHQQHVAVPTPQELNLNMLPAAPAKVQPVQLAAPQEKPKELKNNNSGNNNYNPLTLSAEQIQQLNIFAEPVTPTTFHKIMQEAFTAALQATINTPLVETINQNNNNGMTASTSNNNFGSSDDSTAFLNSNSQQQPTPSKRPTTVLTKRPQIIADDDELFMLQQRLPPSPTQLIGSSQSAGAPVPSKKRKNDKFSSLQVQVPVMQAPIRMTTGTTPTKENFLLSPLLPSSTLDVPQSTLFPPTPTN